MGNVLEASVFQKLKGKCSYMGWWEVVFGGNAPSAWRAAARITLGLCRARKLSCFSAVSAIPTLLPGRPAPQGLSIIPQGLSITPQGLSITRVGTLVTDLGHSVAVLYPGPGIETSAPVQALRNPEAGG